MNDNSSRVMDIDINDILPNRFQPRIQFDENEILELSDSIKEHGVIQPIVVRTVGDKYEIIAGERRYKASVLAGKETVPVIVKNLNDKDSAEIALIENIQRRNLTAIEEALSYKKILDMGYLTQTDLAVKLGKSQSSVANKIRLLNLSDKVQEALLENKISERHARSLLRLETSKQQNDMLDRIITERLTVRKTDEEIDKIKNEPSGEDNDSSQKIIEKGEINMNNNLMPGFNQNPQPTTTPNFDIFGTNTPAAPSAPVAPVVPEAPIMPEMPVAPATPAMPEVSTPNFDIFGSSTPAAPSAPVAPVVPEAPIMPEMPVAPATPAMPEVSTPNFDIFGLNTPAAPSEPVAPVVPPVPEVPAAPANTGSFEFDANGNVMAAPSEPVASVAPEIPAMPEIPATPTMPEVPVTPVAPAVPETNPIIEPQIVQQSDDLFSFGTPTPEVSTVPEVSEVPATPAMPEVSAPTTPEPIIITDYTKQYDPIMPQQAPTTPAVDFKEVINAIRECSSKIEQYGFKIDVEEYDLANLYQVIFKIEK